MTAGTPFDITVTELLADGITTDTGYDGTIHFTTTDSHVAPRPVLPPDYVFTGADNGVHTFALADRSGGTMNTAGSQTIIVTETTNNLAGTGDYTASPAPIDHFSWTAQPGITHTAGAGFTATIKAYDIYGNLRPTTPRRSATES